MKPVAPNSNEATAPAAALNCCQAGAGFAPASGSVRRWRVSGYASMPVKVRIEIKAKDAEAAMTAANKRLKKDIRMHIVSNSADEGAAYGFSAFDAEEIKAPNVKLTP